VADDCKRVLISGCGDVGRRLASGASAAGYRVTGLVRSRTSAKLLASLAIDTVTIDLDRPGALPGSLVGEAQIVHLAPPPACDQADPRLARLLAAATADCRPTQLIYLSTSGIYGDRQGDWVDEESAPAPQSERARRRLAAEQLATAWSADNNCPLTILRVGGIYGPGRLPLARLRRQEPILKEEQSGYSNRIHVDDLITIILAALRERSSAIYNVSDGRPGTMSGYFKAVARHCGLPAPPEIDLDQAARELSPAMLSYLRESRRLDSRRVVAELAISLRYPDLASGLANCDCHDQPDNRSRRA
jgi:nucleoside-diphosphate-sugar epimerase